MPDTATLAAIRFGTGLPLPPGGPDNPQAMLALLRGPDTAAAARPGPGLPEALAALRDGLAARRAQRDPARQDEAATIRKSAQREALGIVFGAAQLQAARAVESPDGLRERLVRFWTDHFTVRNRAGVDKPLSAVFADTAIRPHVAGRFADLLRAAVLHPAMLLYLDQSTSIGPSSPVGRRRGKGLNENLARELIELHTLGVGADYAQADVRELAELLTGLGIEPDQGTVFRPNWAEPGAETVLGRSYDGEGMAPILSALDDLAARPETAAHLSRKLAVHFVADEPDPALVGALAETWRGSGGDLAAVAGTLMSHPAAWAPDLRKTRQPWDLVVAGMRALGMTGEAVAALSPQHVRRDIVQPMAAMGQPWLSPRGPDGWPEPAEAWITPQMLAGRIAWAMRSPARLVAGLPEPVAMARAALGPMADGRLMWAVERAETRAEAVGLILASPQFNRR